MKKNIALVLTILIIAITIVTSIIVIQSDEHAPQKTDRITVVTTLFPLYDFAKHIAGEHANVILLLPPGVEPHTFEPTPRDIMMINASHLFIYTGGTMEPWAEDLLSNMNDRITIVEAGENIETINAPIHDDVKHRDYDAQKNDGNTEHAHTNIDPHIWLDLDNAQIMIDTITHTLVNKDPTHSTDYEKNAAAYKEKLSALAQAYETSLARCQTRDIVYGGHYAFGYLSRKYNLQYHAAYGISPDAEPSAHDLAQLVEQVRTHHTAAIFYEELLSDKIAQTIAQETDAQLLPLHPAHNITKNQYRDGVTFLSIMEDNLQNLIQGLSCN